MSCGFFVQVGIVKVIIFGCAMSLHMYSMNFARSRDTRKEHRGQVLNLQKFLMYQDFPHPLQHAKISVSSQSRRLSAIVSYPRERNAFA